MDKINQILTLTQILQGASKTVDVLATHGLGFLRLYENIARRLDGRLGLRRRCILATPEAMSDREQRDFFLLVEQVFHGTDWEVRLSRLKPTLNCVIVDGREGFLTSLNGTSIPSTGPTLHLITPSTVLNTVSEHFEFLWSSPDILPNQETEIDNPLAGIGYEQLLISSIPAQAEEILIASNEFWDRQIQYFMKNPEKLRTTNPRHFEELVAELLSRNGLDIELTPSSNDGGRDILAWANTLAGRHLYLVECKRYAADRPVGVAIVRALYGVVQAENATSGLVVATSDFTRGAQRFQETVKHRLDLRGYEGLIAWLKRTV